MYNNDTTTQFIVEDRYEGKRHYFKDENALIDFLATRLENHVRWVFDRDNGRIKPIVDTCNVINNCDVTGNDVDFNGNCKRYFVYDSAGRIINAKDYEEQAEIRAIQKRERNWRKQCKETSDRIFEEHHCVFRRTPVYRTGKVRGNYYRNPKMWHNYRETHIKEYEKYTRKKAGYYGETLWWDDYPRNLYRNWKHQSKKKRQWM